MEGGEQPWGQAPARGHRVSDNCQGGGGGCPDSSEGLPEGNGVRGALEVELAKGIRRHKCWAKGEHVGSEGASHAPGSRHCHLAEATEAMREEGRLSGAG